MEIQTRLRIHQAVEFIKQDSEFSFDTHDDPEDILSYYGIDLDLNRSEKQLLLREIVEISKRAQTKEVLSQITRQVEG